MRIITHLADMKQHITQKQLEELDEFDRIKIKNQCLSIGQMIEFLDEEYGSWKLDSWQDWEIVNTQENKNIVLAKNDELCDALWEAVKEVLEK